MQSLMNLIETKTRYNCLSFATHERSQSNMSDINCDFYLYNKPPHIKKWNNQFAELPKNHYSLPNEYFPEAINFDFVISQNKFGQFEIAKNFAQSLKIPLISIEHTWPTTNIPQKTLDYMKSLRGDINIFIGKNQAKAWEEPNPVIIGHCVDTNIFYPRNQKRTNHILSVANDYPGRDYCLGFQKYLNVTKGLPTYPVGDSPGFSKPARDVNHLSQIYASSRIFINTSSQSPIPTSLLEALASGCACVSYNNCDISSYIEHGINGFLANSDQEMRQYLELLLKDEDYAALLGDNARKTILIKCSKESFTNQWNNILDSIIRSQTRDKK